MAVDPLEYRRSVGRFATGVTVCTTVADGVHHAMTANSFTSVSLDPVLMLISVDRTARFHEAVLEARAFGVNVLSREQEALSREYATRGRPLDPARFADHPHVFGEHTGVILFSESLATFECVTHSVLPGGDHTLVVGEVVAIAQPADAPPLLYFNGDYWPGPAGPPHDAPPEAPAG